MSDLDRALELVFAREDALLRGVLVSKLCQKPSGSAASLAQSCAAGHREGGGIGEDNRSPARHINMAWSLVDAGHLPVASGLAFFGSIEKLKSSSGDVCDEVASRPGNTTVFARRAQSKSRDAICLRDRDLSDSVSLSSIKVPLQVSLSSPGRPDVTGGLAGLLGMPSCRKSSTLTTGRPAGASGLAVLDPGCRKRKACQGNRSKIRERLGPVCPLLLLHPCTRDPAPITPSTCTEQGRASCSFLSMAL